MLISMYDVSAMLYIGNSVDRPRDDFLSEKLRGLPVKGLRYTLEKLIASSSDYQKVIAVMDNETNKKEFFEGYKSNRTFNSEVFFQRELLRFLLPNLGITMLSQKQFEADDLFYCYIFDKFVNNDIPNEGINLHCDDVDLVGTVIDRRIVRVGLNSNTPLLDVDNYSFILHRKGFDVPYNAILPYILFKGKASNNLHAITTEKWKTCFDDYMQFVRDKYPNRQNLYSVQSMIDAWLLKCQGAGQYSEAFYNEIQSRIPVVYPRMNWNKNTAIINGKLNNKIATEFLTILNEKKLLSYLKLRTIPDDAVNMGILDKWRNMYMSGTTAVDNFITADSTFFFTGDESSNDNIGGF